MCSADAYTHPTKISGEILRCYELKIAYASTNPIQLAIKAGEKIHLRGVNGCGKSTFLKTIKGLIKPIAGEINSNAKLVYLDQNVCLLNQNISAYEFLKSIYSNLSEQQIRTALGNLQIRREKSLAPISSLSGGERLKVALVALKFQTVELLLLDEPDNHLDIESRELLARAIRSFHGSVILVSHDELFVKECGIEESCLLN